MMVAATGNANRNNDRKGSAVLSNEDLLEI